MNRRINFTAAVTLLACAVADAQHVDVLLWNDAGKVGVGEYNFDTLQANEKRVHLGRFDDLYSVNNPGFTAQTSVGALPGNEDLVWDFLPMAVDSGTHAGHRSTILYWDGLGESPDFGPTATEDYEFSVFSLVDSGAATGGGDIEPGGVITTTPPAGTLHEHPYYFLDDNGDGLNTTLPEPGIYVVALQLSIGVLEPSDPVFLVWATPELEVLPAIQPAATWVRERVDSLAAEPLPGDFNLDGLVDAADYTVWRDGPHYGASDYESWLQNYGASAADSGAAFAVPEPSLASTVAPIVALLVTRSRLFSFLGANDRAGAITWSETR